MCVTKEHLLRPGKSDVSILITPVKEPSQSGVKEKATINTDARSAAIESEIEPPDSDQHIEVSTWYSDNDTQMTNLG
jgi:hypothetical protein